MGQRTDISFRLAVMDTKTAVLGATPAWGGEIAAALSLADGTGAGQADLNYLAERTVASATNDDLDLAGVLASALGETVAGAELVALAIINAPRNPADAANTTNLTIGLGSNPVLGFLGGTLPTIGPLKPGAGILLFAGDAAGLGAIAAGTGDILRIANSSGAAAKYQIAIIARSA